MISLFIHDVKKVKLGTPRKRVSDKGKVYWVNEIELETGEGRLSLDIFGKKESSVLPTT